MLNKRRFGESATTMAGHSGVEMTNYYEEDPDNIEWKIAESKLDLKADLKREALPTFYKLCFLDI